MKAERASMQASAGARPPSPSTTRVVVNSRVPAPAAALFALRRDPWNLRALSPLLPIHLEAPSRPVQPGDIHHIHMRLLRRTIRWELGIVEVAPDRRIVDVQRRGPFRAWRHQHIVVPCGEMESTLVDVIDFRFFPRPWGRVLDRLLVRSLLWVEFTRQQRRLRRLLIRPQPLWQRMRRRAPGSTP